VATVTPTPAAAPTPAPAVTPVVVPVEDTPVPLADMSDIDSPDNEETRTVEDEETPLANMAAATGLVHQIQHVCEVVASGVLPFLFAGSNRKRKNRLSELRKEIDEKTEGKEN